MQETIQTISLHWLPVFHRSVFKTALLVYKFLHSGNPKYFEPFLKPRSSVYRTRSSQSDGVLLEVPHCASIYKSKKHFGHSFAYDATRIWNDLPGDVRSAKSLSSFRKKLKTYLFEKAYPPQITLSFSICLLRGVDPCNFPDLTITISNFGFLHLRVYHQIEIKCYKSIIRIRIVCYQ